MDNNFISFDDDGLDPAIASALHQGKQRQSFRNMNQSDRKRVNREKRKAAKRVGKRATYDLPSWLIDYLKNLAEHYQTSASQLAMLGLVYFAINVDKGDLSIDDYLMSVDNPRYQNMVSIELPPSWTVDKF